MAARLPLAYFRLGWIYVLHVVFSGLLLAKLTDETSWNWFIVFVPVYVFDVVAVAYWITYLITYAQLKYDGRLEDDDVLNALCFPSYNERNTPTCFPKQSLSLIVLLMYAAGILLKMASEVLLCFALNGTISFIAPGSAYSVLLLGSGLLFLYFSLKPTVYMLASDDR